MSEYEQQFNDALNRYRKTGAGGVSMPQTDTGRAPEVPVQDPSKNVRLEKGVVVVGGGKNTRTPPRPNLGIHIFDYGKPTEENKTDK